MLLGLVQLALKVEDFDRPTGLGKGQEPFPSIFFSTLEPLRGQIGNWYAAGIKVGV